MKVNRIVLTGALAVLATFAALVPANLQAQTNADITQEAFQVTETINLLSCFCYTPVAIPAGKRLVIQDVSLSGAAQSTEGNIQPIIILAATLGTNNQNLRYFAPAANTLVPGQFYSDYPTTVYADSLEVGPAFSGFDPSFDTFNVVITGYLVPAPKNATPAASTEK